MARTRRASCKFKKKRTVHDEGWQPADLSGEEIVEDGYIQNSEQGEETIWQRIQRNRRIFKPMDALYREYELHGFKDLDLSSHDQTDPKIQLLTSYVDKLKTKSIKLDDIPLEHRQALVDLLTNGR